MKKEDKIKDEELSMTRSFKYKKVQDDIDDLEIEKTKEIKISKNVNSKKKNNKVQNVVVEEDGFFEDIMSKKEKKNYDLSKAEELTQVDIKKLKKKAERKEKKRDNEEITEDDLFITQSFKPLRKRSKLFKLLKPILFFLLFGIILFCLVYFYVYPKLMPFFITPRYVFEKAIDNVAVSVKDKISSIDDGVNGFDLSIDVNSNKYSIFNGYNYSFSYLYNNNEYMSSFNYNENGKDLGMNLYFLNDKKYLNYSNNGDLYNISNYDDLDEYYQYYNKITKKLNMILDKDDTLYLIDKSSEFLKSILNEDNLSKDNATLFINGVKEDVTKYSLNIDNSYYMEIKKAYVLFVKQDTKYLNIMASLNNMCEEDYLNYLDDILLKNRDIKLVFDIYMINGDEFVGTDVSINGFRSFYYYELDTNVEMYLNLSDYIKGTFKDKVRNFVILLKGTKNENKADILLNYNGRDKVELNIKNDSDNYVFNYTIINSNNSGKILIKDDNKGLILNRVSYDDDINIEIDYINRSIDISNYEMLESDKKFKNSSNLFEKEFKKNKYVYSFDEFIKVFK